MRPFHRGEPAEHGEAEVAIHVTTFVMVLHRKVAAFIVRAGGRDSDGSRSVDTKNRRTGVRGTIVALKPGNSDGAKGAGKMEGVMENEREDKSAIVPVAQQAEAVAAYSTWRTAKTHVWTERMLTALITSVKGGK
jgi:hypothetical protein